MKIAILLPVFNKLNYTITCLNALHNELSHHGLMDHFRVILVDDGSRDGTDEYVRKHFPWVTILRGDGNLWWSGGINMGAEYAVSNLGVDYLLLWNNDIITHSGYFVNLLKLLRDSDKNTIIGSKIYMDYEKRIIWAMGGFINPYIGKIGNIGYNKTDNKHYQQPMEVDWIPGMGTAIPVEVVKKIGYWDNINYPQYHGDLEFTHRAKINGFKLFISPDLIISNDTRNTAIGHEGSFKKFLGLLHDKRSLYNFRVNTSYIRKHGKGPFKYMHLFISYTVLLVSFLKWKILTLFNLKKDK